MATTAADAPRPSQAVLEIDLGAIVRNWRALAARLAPGCACAAVVKADAYGLGAGAVAPALAAAGAREFFVAQLGEAAALAGRLPPTCRVYVLGGLLAGEEAEFRALGAIPVLNDPGQVARWAAAARAAGVALPAALHLDTGMARLGLEPGEAEALAAEPARTAGLDLVLVVSHLARAEEAVAMNDEQLARFRRLRARWPGAPASLANSSGIFLGPDWHFDLARPGAALYGINPLPGRPNPQEPVAKLLAKVLQVREIHPPTTVGYGAAWRADSSTRVATIGVGYADGWPRGLAGRGAAAWRGRRLPFIGRVSMDLITLDAGAAPGLEPGDAVELLGPARPVDAVADEAGTNGYEILARLGARFARVHRAAPA